MGTRLKPLTRKQLAPAAAGIAIAIYFLAFTSEGLRAYFNTDDLVNLNIYAGQSVGALLKAVLLYFTPSYRPLGGLFYRSLFGIFGLHPLPYRVVCFLFLGIDLLLVYFSFRVLTGSRETGALAALIATFHARLADLYWSSGTIYDILCFTFYFAALYLYWRVRKEGRLPGIVASVSFLGLYVFALDSKEMAVTLPAVLALSELICFRSKEWRAYRLAAIAALTTLPYVFGKLAPESLLSQNPSYRLDISVERFLAGYGVYLGDLFYRDGRFTVTDTAGVLLCLLIAALLARSRYLLFAWSFLIVTILPVVFIPPRAGFVFYLPFAGWCLYVAVLLDWLRALVARSLPGTAALALKGVLFALVLALLLKAHHIQRLRMGGPSILRQPLVRSLVSELNRRQVRFPRGARVLVVNDPFPDGEYGLLLLLRLYVSDPTLNIQHGGASEEIRCGYSLEWSGTTLQTFRQPPQNCPGTAE